MLKYVNITLALATVDIVNNSSAYIVCLCPDQLPAKRAQLLVHKRFLGIPERVEGIRRLPQGMPV